MIKVRKTAKITQIKQPAQILYRVVANYARCQSLASGAVKTGLRSDRLQWSVKPNIEILKITAINLSRITNNSQCVIISVC